MARLAKTGRDEEIEQAALKLFLRHGFQKVRLGEIAEACGVSRPTLYGLYPNKEAILSSIIRRHAAGMAERIADGIGRVRGLRSRLRYIVEQAVLTPHAAAIEDDYFMDLSNNAMLHAADATAEFWDMVTRMLDAECAAGFVTLPPARRQDGVRALVMAIRGAKAVATRFDEFELAVATLIDMTLAWCEAQAPAAGRQAEGKR